MEDDVERNVHRLLHFSIVVICALKNLGFFMLKAHQK